MPLHFIPPLTDISFTISTPLISFPRACSTLAKNTSPRPLPPQTHASKPSTSNLSFPSFLKHHSHQRRVSLLTHGQDPSVFVTMANEKFGVIFTNHLTACLPLGVPAL